LDELLFALLEPPVLEKIQQHVNQFATFAHVLGPHLTTLRKKIEQYRLEQ
jgi:DNA-binding protein Fis